jgi:hypothetical protein
LFEIKFIHRRLSHFFSFHSFLEKSKVGVGCIRISWLTQTDSVSGSLLWSGRLDSGTDAAFLSSPRLRYALGEAGPP